MSPKDDNVAAMIDSATRASYTGSRPDVVALFGKLPDRLLDVGCSTGAMAGSLTRVGVETWGIEIDPTFAVEASAVLSKVLVGDAQEMTAQLIAAGEQFDTVVCADVLEHTRDPWTILRNVRGLIRPDGEVVVSLPNVGYVTTILWLIFHRRWRYEDRGVHDRTHLRWFTDLNARDMFAEAGFQVDATSAQYRLADRPGAWVNRLTGVLRILPRSLQEFFVYQHLYRLRSASAGNRDG
jgi:2-polyprenyl-3-methyl-5-hydroxy-6-metoxy-1,4-benzoquinol methylase